MKNEFAVMKQLSVRQTHLMAWNTIIRLDGAFQVFSFTRELMCIRICVMRKKDSMMSPNLIQALTIGIKGPFHLFASLLSSSTPLYARGWLIGRGARSNRYQKLMHFDG